MFLCVKRKKMDELKKHIQQKLNDLDIDEPSEDGWQHIQQNLFPPKRVVIALPVRWVAAACVVLLVGIGIFLFDKNHEATVSITPAKKEINNMVKNEPQPIAAPATKEGIGLKLTDKVEKKAVVINEKRHSTRNNRAITKSGEAEEAGINELEGIENSFKQVIDIEKTRVNATPLNAEDPSYFKEFSQRIKEMEADEAMIKQEMRQKGITNDLLDRLINIYQQKLNVLKQLQNEIQKTNSRYKQARKQTADQKTYFLNI